MGLAGGGGGADWGLEGSLRESTLNLGSLLIASIFSRKLPSSLKVFMVVVGEEKQERWGEEWWRGASPQEGLVNKK